MLQQTSSEFPQQESFGSFACLCDPRVAAVTEEWKDNKALCAFVFMRGELTAMGEFGLLVRVYTAYKLQKKNTAISTETI